MDRSTLVRVAGSREPPVGHRVTGWSGARLPGDDPMVGRVCRVDRLMADDHGADLAAAETPDERGRGWTYLPVGPWRDAAGYVRWLRSVEGSSDPQFWAISDLRSGRACGFAAFLAAKPQTGSIEIGWIYLAPHLRGTTAATEAMFLMMRRAFEECGYRRYEWKCDALNAPSRRAAQRLGFSYEGTFRQHQVVKGRNRDTAWFSLLDREWPATRAAFEEWLSPANFDPQGRQHRRLKTPPRRE